MSTSHILKNRYEGLSATEEYAQHEVVDLGTALRTCSQYLMSTARPAFYRAAVESLLKRGVRYVCFALDPDAEVSETYASLRGESGLAARTQDSIRKIEEFARTVAGSVGSFELYLYSSLPHFAGIAMDRKMSSGLLLYAPYLPNLGERFSIERADSPHVVVTAHTVPTLFGQVDSYIDALFGNPQTRRVI